MVSGYHANPKDFDIVATRIHRILTLRRMTLPFVNEDQGDDYYQALIEKSLEWISAIHDTAADSWENPNVSYQSGMEKDIDINEALAFIWQSDTPLFSPHHRRMTLWIGEHPTKYEILSIDNGVASVLFSGIIEGLEDLPSIWASWLIARL